MVAAIRVLVTIDKYHLHTDTEVEQTKTKEALTDIFKRRVPGIASVGVETFPYNLLMEVTLKPPADGCFSLGESELVERAQSRGVRAEIAKAVNVEIGRVYKLVAKVQR